VWITQRRKKCTVFAGDARFATLPEAQAACVALGAACSGVVDDSCGAVPAGGTLRGRDLFNAGQVQAQLVSNLNNRAPAAADLQLEDGERVVQAVASSADVQHSVVLTNRRVLTFGARTGSNGQLGRRCEGITCRSPLPMNLTMLHAGEGVMQVAVGAHHTLLLTRHRRVLSVGENTNGCLGYETKETENFVARPVALGLGAGEVAEHVSACSTFSLVKTNQRLLVFGRIPGQAGDERAVRNVAIGGAAGEVIMHVTTGVDHAVVVTNQRTLTFGNCDGGCSATPLPVAGIALREGERATAISAGKGDNNLVLTSQGRVLQTADPIRQRNWLTADKDIVLPSASGVAVNVAAGPSHGLVLTSMGHLYSFGRNDYGVLGYDTPNCRYDEDSGCYVKQPPSRLHIDLLVGETIEGVAAGNRISLLKTNRRVLTWGKNWAGALGRSSGVHQVVPAIAQFGEALQPGESIIQISSGSGHTIALTSGLRVLTFGRNTFGQLGRPADYVGNKLEEVVGLDLAADEHVKSVNAGRQMSFVLTSKRLLSFGRNEYFHYGLGRGTGVDQVNEKPMQVTSIAADLHVRIKEVSGGGRNALVTLDDGQVLAFGSNINAQGGSPADGVPPRPFKFQSTPATPVEMPQLPAGETVHVAAAGREHSVIATNKRIFTFGGAPMGGTGGRDQGELGRVWGDFSVQPIQFAFESDERVEQIEIGEFHNLIRTNQRVLAFGSNKRKQLAVPPVLPEAETVPRVVTLDFSAAFDTDERVLRIAAGGDSSFFLTNKGRVWSAGDNQWGQLAHHMNETSYGLGVMELDSAAETRFGLPSLITASQFGASIAIAPPLRMSNNTFVALAADGSGSTEFTVDPPVWAGDGDTPAQLACVLTIDGAISRSNATYRVENSGETVVSCNAASDTPFAWHGTKPNRVQLEYDGFAPELFLMGRDPTNTTNAHYARLCPAGTTSTGSRPGAMDGAEFCAPCAPGYVSVAGALVCTPCWAGTFATANGCVPCDEGSFSGAVASACTTCARGSFADKRGSAGCVACTEAGQWTNGKQPCATCVAGQYSVVGASHYQENEHADCLTCPQHAPTSCVAGKYQAGSDCNCVPCEAGRFAQFKDSVGHCKGCAAGRYQDIAINNVACKFCVAGKYSNTTIATKAGVCKTCEFGKFAPMGASKCTGCPTQIDACPLGKFRDSKAIACSCTNCMAGQFSSDATTTTCQNCDAGKYSRPGARACTNCSPGKKASTSGSVMCDSCRPGTVTAVPASEQCTQCAAGMFQSLSKQVTCTACPCGKWSDPAAVYCTKCRVGSNADTCSNACVQSSTQRAPLSILVPSYSFARPASLFAGPSGSCAEEVDVLQNKLQQSFAAARGTVSLDADGNDKVDAFDAVELFVAITMQDFGAKLVLQNFRNAHTDSAATPIMTVLTTVKAAINSFE
jgi:alpha-tubulin suppressor-like RCC1 family protein